MLTVKRIKGTVQVGFTDLATTYDPVAQVLWLRTVHASYQIDGCPMQFEQETEEFLRNAGADVLLAMATISLPGQQLIQWVCSACTSQERNDFDYNLELIAQVLARARAIEVCNEKLKFVYTVRKPNPDALTLIMALRSDVYRTFGLQAGLLVTNALVAAIKRERQLAVYVLNPPVPDGFDRAALRPAAKFDSHYDADALRIFCQYVLKMSTDEIKASLNLIKSVSEHYRHLELPASNSQPQSKGQP
ncbi:hypothetical protein [Pseudomonas serbica]|uniref:hypothetical protein n=1 Tax=Pseudomonas serbica TaxID=2965074 RepID=UPI00237B8143|nr:hypothetical protein [Pseudomonas serbica]